MSDPLDRPCTAVWLLFCQEPTDRALAGWSGLGSLDFIVRQGEHRFVRWVCEQLWDVPLAVPVAGPIPGEIAQWEAHHDPVDPRREAKAAPRCA